MARVSMMVLSVLLSYVRSSRIVEMPLIVLCWSSAAQIPAAANDYYSCKTSKTTDASVRL